MLLRNKSRIIYKILIDLVFDDESTKCFTVGIDDVVKINYRRNGELRKGIGKIIDIIPINIGGRRINEDCYCHENYNDNAKLLIDFGDLYKSDKKYIKLDDIIDITIITEEEYSCHAGNMDKDDIDDIFFDKDFCHGDTKYHHKRGKAPHIKHSHSHTCVEGESDFDEHADISKEDIDEMF